MKELKESYEDYLKIDTEKETGIEEFINPQILNEDEENKEQKKKSWHDDSNPDDTTDTTMDDGSLDDPKKKKKSGLAGRLWNSLSQEDEGDVGKSFTGWVEKKAGETGEAWDKAVAKQHYKFANRSLNAGKMSDEEVDALAEKLNGEKENIKNLKIEIANFNKLPKDSQEYKDGLEENKEMVYIVDAYIELATGVEKHKAKRK